MFGLFALAALPCRPRFRMRLSLGFQLSFQFRLHLTGLFLFRTNVKEPALKFSLRRCPQALQFNHGVEEIGPRGGKIGDLT